MKTIELNAENLAEILQGAGGSIGVAGREYLRMLAGRFTQPVIEAEGARILEALRRGEQWPEGEPVLQIAALFQVTQMRAVNEYKAIEHGVATGDSVASLYFLLSQQTGFLMALDAQLRGDPEQWNVLRSQMRSELASHAATARASKPGGSRENRETARAAWASVPKKYASKDECAEAVSKILGISFSTARKYLRGA